MIVWLLIMLTIFSNFKLLGYEYIDRQIDNKLYRYWDTEHPNNSKGPIYSWHRIGEEVSCNRDKFVVKGNCH